MSNTYLKKGQASLEELVSEAGRGVYIKNFMEWNIDDTRSFSRYQGNVAYLIENHRIGKPVKNYVLETKTLDFWHSVQLVGNEMELYVGSCGKGEPLQGVPVTMGGASAYLDMDEGRAR
jgi:TldD protein